LLVVLLVRKFSIGIAVVLTLGTTAIPSFAAPTTLKVTNPPSEVVIGGPGGGTKSFLVDVVIRGEQDAEITAKFVDVIYGADGKKDNLESGSTPYSLSQVLEIEKFDGSFRASEETKTFQIKVRTKVSKISEMFYGGFVVQAVPKSSNPKKNQASATATTSGIVSQINVFPYGFAGGKNKDKILPSEISSISFSTINRTSVIDSLIPDIPGVMNSGPIQAKVTYKNIGALPVFATANWTFSADGKEIATQSSGRALVRAGRSASRATITQAKVEGTEKLANVLPAFGVVEVQTTLISDIAGTTFDPVVEKSSVLIVQWKEPFFFIALGLIFVWYVLRKRPAADDKKRKEPSLAWLAIKALRKEIDKLLAKRKAPKSPNA
jgi:hypothetical protein